MIAVTDTFMCIRAQTVTFRTYRQDAVVDSTDRIEHTASLDILGYVSGKVERRFSLMSKILRGRLMEYLSRMDVCQQINTRLVLNHSLSLNLLAQIMLADDVF